jgi:hypothetical protein
LRRVIVQNIINFFSTDFLLIKKNLQHKVNKKLLVSLCAAPLPCITTHHRVYLIMETAFYSLTIYIYIYIYIKYHRFLIFSSHDEAKTRFKSQQTSISCQSKSQNASPSHFEMENPSESYIPQYFLNMILFIFPLINFTSEDIFIDLAGNRKCILWNNIIAQDGIHPIHQYLQAVTRLIP